MSYNPATDFLGLIRATGGGVRSEEMPGLDYVVAALARFGAFALSVGQTAPMVNQATTVWLQPAQPSWSAEGTVYLWNAIAGAYQVANPVLWKAFLSSTGPLFQSLPAANNIIGTGVTLAAVQRVAPANTAITLPSLAGQYLTQKDILLTDFSTGIVGTHAILITTPDGATIMQKSGVVGWQLLSTEENLGSMRLRPSPDLNAWIIA